MAYCFRANLLSIFKKVGVVRKLVRFILPTSQEQLNHYQVEGIHFKRDSLYLILLYGNSCQEILDLPGFDIVANITIFLRR